MNYLYLYLITLVVFFAIDIFWLALVARKFYSRHLGFIMSASPNWLAAVIFYLIFIGGLVYFALAPGLQAGSFSQALLSGALFGLVTYATYDLTNLATLKDWPVIITVVDLVWGVVLSSLVTSISFWLAGLLL